MAVAFSHPTITWDISLGSILTASVFVMTMIGYYFINQAEVDKREISIQAEQKLDYAVLNLKLLQDDQKYATLALQDADFHARMQTAIDKVTAAIQDIRLQLVQKEDIKHR